MSRYGPAIDPDRLQKFLEESGLSYSTNRRSYIFTCPRCSKRNKLFMLKADGRFICWTCGDSGFKGRAEFALSAMTGLSPASIRKTLHGQDVMQDLAVEGYFQIHLQDFYDPGEAIEDEILESQVSKNFPLDFLPIDHFMAVRGLTYLQKRDIDLELARFYGLHYSPVARRVIFPIRSGDKLLGWQARAVFNTEVIDQDGKKIKIPKILTEGDRNTLMFLDRLAGSEHAVICEGPVDALKAHLCGGNVATMGKIVSRTQIDIIKGSGVRKIYLALDPDAAAETAKLVKEFADFEVYRLLPPKGCKDLGECTLEEVKRQFDSAPRIYPGQLFLHFGK